MRLETVVLLVVSLSIAQGQPQCIRLFANSTGTDSIYSSWYIFPRCDKETFRATINCLGGHSEEVQLSEKEHQWTGLRPFTQCEITVAVANANSIVQVERVTTWPTAGVAAEIIASETVITNTTIYIRWRVPSGQYGDVKGYHLLGAGINANLTRWTTEYTFTALEPFTVYNFSIAVENMPSEDALGGGLGNYTLMSYRTCSGLGRPVQNLTVIPLHREAAISWKLHQPTFGDIEKYLIEVEDTRASIFNRDYSPNIKLPLVIPNLMPGEQYTISVVTVNKAENGCVGSGGHSPAVRRNFKIYERSVMLHLY
ncbi:unnamed protein product [Schistocephalus solidus]|uniref:Fibronectin type III domain protein n=1 Tax=Schistocephalus solidus TaxID=70667 RepID=A0A183TKL7_SCHSO|nr:unnamed protein product [Schistocephalus solidus]